MVLAKSCINKQEATGYHIELEIEDDITPLPELSANSAIATILQDYSGRWSDDQKDMSMIYTCRLKSELEEKYGSWFELKLNALAEICEA